MRTLYFDIDGTLLILNTGEPKPALEGGTLEQVIRATGVDELVCVGNFAGIVRTVWTVKPEYDGLGAIFRLCRGVFRDEAWFRAHTRLVVEPKLRAAEVELKDDWWYMDDQAEKYFEDADRAEIFRMHRGRRILEPAPEGNGDDVLNWMVSIPRSAATDPVRGRRPSA